MRTSPGGTSLQLMKRTSKPNCSPENGEQPDERYCHALLGDDRPRDMLFCSSVHFVALGMAISEEAHVGAWRCLHDMQFDTD
jgi:hypothetical protein